MSIKMIKNKDIGEHEAMWVEHGPLAKFAALVVWKFTKSNPVRAKYRIAYGWGIKISDGNYKVTGFGRTYRQALIKAAEAQNYILRNSVQEFAAPEFLFDRWENMVAD